MVYDRLMLPSPYLVSMVDNNLKTNISSVYSQAADYLCDLAFNFITIPLMVATPITLIEMRPQDPGICILLIAKP